MVPDVALIVGVLIEVPPEVHQFYIRMAADRHQSFEEVVAEDCRTACAEYFKWLARGATLRPIHCKHTP